MIRRLLSGFVVLFAVSGFAQEQENPASKPSTPESAAVKESKPADSAPQIAYLHVYRHRRYVGSGLAPTISVDLTKVARVGNGRRFTARLQPGTHTVRSDDKSSAVTIDAKAGEHYYVRIDEEAGFWKGHGRMTLLMPDQGKAEYPMQKPVEDDRRFAKDMLEVEADPGH
jgi:hypothetical protein